MTGTLANTEIDKNVLVTGPQDSTQPSEGREPQITNIEDMDSTIVADTTLTNGLSQHGFNVSHLKKDSIASSSHSGIFDVQPGSSEQSAVQRGPRSPDAPTHGQASSDLVGGDTTLDVTFVAEDHDQERKEGWDDLTSGNRNVTEADETLPNGSDIPSSSSPARSHARPGGLELNLEPPSPQPWDLVIPPSEFDPTKTTGLSIPGSGRGFSPVASKFSAMQATGNGSRLVPKSSYFYGAPPPDAAYGTPPIGQIGVHHPREIFRVERDYTGGEIIQFAPIYPLELESRLTPTQFLESINSINETLISAHSMRHAFVDNLVTVATLQLSRLFMSTHYQKEMKRLRHVLDDLNTMLFNPVGLNILWPGDVAFLYLEIEYYIAAASAGVMSSLKKNETGKHGEGPESPFPTSPSLLSHPLSFPDPVLVVPRPLLAAQSHPDCPPYPAIAAEHLQDAMDSYRDSAAIWDFTNPAHSYTHMQDIDFMALLDKPYAGNAHHSTEGNGVVLPGPFHDSDISHQPNTMSSSSDTPPSNDTPSPSDSHDSHADDADGPAPKRKATSEASEGPSSKTMKSGSASASTSSRRKSTGNPAKDESRLLKRKEQNRAAQRAFRERKEKHVRDLEDKVAALEAKNEEAVHENENLRDLLSRLQTENVMLKQGNFTFSMPRDGGISPFSADATSFAQNMPSPSTRSSFTAPSAPSRSKSPNLSNPLDWSSLTTFDPSRLNLLDDLSQQQHQQQQPTATDSAMHLDFGFGPSGLAANTPFTTLASNPMFMSFASSFDSTPAADSPSASSSANHNAALNFDMSSLTSWPVQDGGQTGSLDDLFGYGMANNNNFDLSFLTSPASLSPVTHHITSPLSTGVNQPISLSPSPSSSSTDPLYTPKDSPPHQDFDVAGHDTKQCPKTKAELVKCIEKSGPSPFAPSCNPGTPGVRKSMDGVLGAMVTCEGSTSFPKTQKNPQNVEVLSAWRSITSNPKFKDTDISELCAEFTAKARCDGTKVVLEPSSVDSIIETLSKKHQDQDSPHMQQ